MLVAVGSLYSTSSCHSVNRMLNGNVNGELSTIQWVVKRMVERNMVDVSFGSLLETFRNDSIRNQSEITFGSLEIQTLHGSSVEPTANKLTVAK